MAVAITATEQDEYPPRVLLTITGMTIGVQYELRRIVAGVPETMRDGGIEADATATTVIDAELPFGVPVRWSILLSSTGATLDTDGPLTLTLPGGKVVLSDAITGQSAEVVILTWASRGRAAVASTFVVDGQNIVVSSGLGQYTADNIELFVETTASSDAVRSLLTTCTSGIVQVRQAGGYDGVDGYWAVLGADDQRFSQDGTDQRRIWSLTVAEVSRWAPSLEARGYTLQDLADLYDGLTLTDLAGDYATLLLLAQADLGM